jgi:hypothetical protein
MEFASDKTRSRSNTSPRRSHSLQGSYPLHRGSSCLHGTLEGKTMRRPLMPRHTSIAIANIAVVL